MLCNHFRYRCTSPIFVISIAYSYIAIVIAILYSTGFYRNSSFFNWGPPIKFFDHEITSNTTFYSLQFLIFIHQIVNNWVNNVVYAWIINSVQDPKNKRMEYSRSTSLIIINLFNVYSELDVVFVIMGFMSQISFVLSIILANIITGTIVNDQHIRNKSIQNENEEFLNIV